jgi:hypothetical protein
MKKVVLILIAMLLMATMSVQAQLGTDPLSFWSAGQLDQTDNSVFYSFFVASGEDVVSDIVITAEVPEGATFAAEFWKPEGAVFVGEADGIVTWELPSLERETSTGPFTFQVTFENADAEDFAPPSAASGSVESSVGTLVAETNLEEPLIALEESGSVTLTADGSADLMPVGETGIWILVPEGAVTEDVTLTFSRLAITEDNVLPEVADETWWCGQYSITADKDVTFSEPLTIILPIRRALTPYMEVAVFSMTEGGKWVVQSDGDIETTEGEMAAGVVTNDGLAVDLSLLDAVFSDTPSIVAVGVKTTVRDTSTSVYPIYIKIDN